MRSYISDKLRSFRILIEYLVELLFNSVFIGDDNPVRHTPLLLNIIFYVEIIYMIISKDLYLKISGATLYIIFILLRRRYLVLKPVMILGSIPTIWYMFLASIFSPDPIKIIDVVLRVFIISTLGLVIAQIINPVEISWLIKKIIKKNQNIAMIPSLTWRITPHLLKDLRDSLMVSRLKESETWKSLGVSILLFDEYIDLYEEGLSTIEYRNFIFNYDIKETIKIVILLIMALIFISNLVQI